MSAPRAWGICLALLCGACGPPDAVEPPRADAVGARPNVVLITLESLRTDHVGAYGGASSTQPERPITPTLDALAREGVVYERAHAVTSWTLSSHASLFTGLYPTAHQTRAPVARLGDDYTTLAERLGAVGYQTAAVVSGPYLRAVHNLTQGFDWLDDSSANPMVPRAHSDVTNSGMEAGLIRFVELEREEQRPLFLFAYFWDPHFDFLPPAPYDTMFLDETCERIDVHDFDTSKTIHPGILPGELGFVLSQYDGEIRATDELLGRFFGLLQQRGLWDDALVIVTADHGEEFFDHGTKGHKKNLHRETVQVPLIVKYPTGTGPTPGTRDDRLVSLVDILPTVLEVVGAPADESLQGSSLLAAPDPARAIFFELLSSWYLQTGIGTRNEIEDWAAVRAGDRKLIARRIGDELSAPALYDLARDPTEQRDIADAHPAEVAELVARIREQLERLELDAARYRAGGDADLEAEAADQLCALGYLHCEPEPEPEIDGAPGHD